jgi:hypothetical protein
LIRDTVRFHKKNRVKSAFNKNSGNDSVN